VFFRGVVQKEKKIEETKKTEKPKIKFIQRHRAKMLRVVNEGKKKFYFSKTFRRRLYLYNE
jgi:hypothetical protein